MKRLLNRLNHWWLGVRFQQAMNYRQREIAKNMRQWDKEKFK